LQADRNSPPGSPELAALLQRERRGIERAQAGELVALEPILASHAEPLLMLILGRVGERADAEDLLKDTFVTALTRIGSFVWQERSIYHWLRQIALNKTIDYHRALGRRRRLCQALKAELTEAEDAAAPMLLSAEEERRLAQQRIDKVLALLHPRYAHAIRLRLGEERPRAECAELLAVSVETFDVLLFRAVRAFRKAYGELDA
jgi:RNA polymerase sigma-70 factor (ECF subfamily)